MTQLTHPRAGHACGTQGTPATDPVRLSSIRHLLPTGAALAAVAVFTHAATAQITPGSTFTFTGTADATDIGLPGVILDFVPRVVAASSGNTGSFTSLNTGVASGVSGHIGGIRVGNGDESIVNFLTIGGYRFDVTSLPSGGFGQDDCYVDPVPGQTCTPYQSVQGDPSVNAGLSPFYVTNVASGNPDAPINSTAAFGLTGTVTGPGGYMSGFTGTISSTFVGTPYQYVLYNLEQEGLSGLTFTGTFVAGPVIGRTGVSVTPEPATYALVAVGLAGVAGATRWRCTSVQG